MVHTPKDSSNGGGGGMRGEWCPDWKSQMNTRQEREGVNGRAEEVWHGERGAGPGDDDE